MEIDNNLVENSICRSRRLTAPSPCGPLSRAVSAPAGGFGCPTAVGKKNWLFIGAETAGATAAILYTIIESARRRGHDPFAYLREALTRLPHMKAAEVIALHPAHWQPAPAKAAA